MAIAGASIDFLCLIFLSVVISQLHKLLAFWDSRKKSPEQANADEASVKANVVRKIPTPARFPEDIEEAAQLYEPLLELLDHPFQLVDLYKVARENDYPHPHLTISSFRQAGILSAVEEGLFSWNH